MLNGGNSRHRSWTAVLILLILATMGISGFGASESPNQAQVNQEFLQFISQFLEGDAPQMETSGGYSLGLRPSPIDLSYTDGRYPVQAQREGVPTSYDLRGTGRLSTVRNQGACGSCWTFGTYAAYESWLLSQLPPDAQDFSENHLKECHAFDWGPCDGGNRDISTAYLARGSGSILESEDPYIAGDDPAGCIPSILACPAPEGYIREGSVSQPIVYQYTRDIHWISGVNKGVDPAPDYLKQAIMDYGAVMTSMYWDDACYDAGNYAYYYSAGSGSNHAVAIVGWDDDFDKTLFPTEPVSNGAWIIRNSWGVGWAESGYFYISYEDTVVATTNTVFINEQDPAGLWIYDYDPYGTTAAYRWVDDNVDWGANVFTAETGGRLTSVGFYTTDVGTSYEIDVRVGSPTGGSLLPAVVSGSCTWPGYHVIDLPTPPSLSTGDVFTIVVKFTNPSYAYTLPIEKQYVGYNTAAAASPGQSYASYDGTNWSDITTWDPSLNVCIKGIFVDEPTSAVFRVTEVGRVRADGTVYSDGFVSGNADVAEWVLVSEPVEAGDVLELDPENPQHYRKSTGSCSSLVAGVVSTNPGFTLGSLPSTDYSPPTTDYALLALIGIVPVKVCNEGGTIGIGDLLVTASIPGYARRWSAEYGPTCHLIGKALEEMTEETGTILVLLMR